jgi:hypothetical protein
MVLQETFILIQKLKTSYIDVMTMPVYERRFFINMLLKQHEKEQEYIEENKNNGTNNSNAKGNRKTKISGDALKNKMSSGEIPLK